jgi:hypothetical protein
MPKSEARDFHDRCARLVGSYVGDLQEEPNIDRSKEMAERMSRVMESSEFTRTECIVATVMLLAAQVGAYNK